MALGRMTLLVLSSSLSKVKHLSWQQRSCDSMCKYAGGKSILGERTLEVFLSVPASESGLNDTTSANKIQRVSCGRPTYLGYELVRCFSTPSEQHSRAIAG